MITVAMRHDIDEAEKNGFLDQYANAIPVLEATPGHKETHLYKDLVIRNRYLITSQWVDHPSFECFARTDLFEVFFASEHTTVSSPADGIPVDRPAAMNPHPRFTSVNV